SFTRRRKPGFEDERDQRAENGEIDDVEEISSRDQRDDLLVERRDLRLIQRIPDKRFDCLRHFGSLPGDYSYIGRFSGSSDIARRRVWISSHPLSTTDHRYSPRLVRLRVTRCAAARAQPPSNCRM